MLTFNLKHLKSFAALADCRHLGQAAQLCCKTPAAVQHAVLELEQSVQAKLLLRLPQGWQLTNEGEVLHKAVKAALQHLAQILVKLPADSGVVARAPFFQLGITNSLAAMLDGLAMSATLSALAKRLGLTQPAVSSALRALEGTLGVVLFKVDRQGLVLTPAGHVVRDHLVLALQVLQSAQAELEQAHDEVKGCARIGLTAYFKTEKFARCLHQVLQQFPQVRLQTYEQGLASMLKSLRSGELDLVFTVIRHDFADPDLQVHAWAQDSLSALVSAAHPLAHASAVSLPQLLEHALLLPPHDAPSRAILDEYFVSQGLPKPVARMESGDVRTLETLLSTGAYVAVASRSIFEEPISQGSVIPLVLPLPSIERRIGLIARKEQFNSLTVQRLAAFFVNWGAVNFVGPKMHH